MSPRVSLAEFLQPFKPFYPEDLNYGFHTGKQVAPKTNPGSLSIVVCWSQDPFSHPRLK